MHRFLKPKWYRHSDADSLWLKIPQLCRELAHQCVCEHTCVITQVCWTVNVWVQMCWCVFSTLCKQTVQILKRGGRDKNVLKFHSCSDTLHHFVPFTSCLTYSLSCLQTAHSPADTGRKRELRGHEGTVSPLLFWLCGSVGMTGSPNEKVGHWRMCESDGSSGMFPNTCWASPSWG